MGLCPFFQCELCVIMLEYAAVKDCSYILGLSDEHYIVKIAQTKNIWRPIAKGKDVNLMPNPLGRTEGKR
jgi:hypothetical protein